MRPLGRRRMRVPTQNFLFLALFLLFSLPVQAVKFSLQAWKYPPSKCIWNTAHDNQLVVISANVGPGSYQRVDIEVVDSSPQKNVYLSKRNIDGETRLAITTHADGEVGVCFKNTLDASVNNDPDRFQRVVDLDVDIGAEAVDYNAIANQESLSMLEVEMRKLEGMVTEIFDELQFLKAREERFSDTNESTNQRVQNFSLFTLCALVALGIWQIFHLRSFFKRKYLID